MGDPDIARSVDGRAFGIVELVIQAAERAELPDETIAFGFRGDERLRPDFAGYRGRQ